MPEVWVLDSNPTPTGYDPGFDTYFAGVGPSNYLTFYSSGSEGGLDAPQGHA
jgi:hypothetical protein